MNRNSWYLFVLSNIFHPSAASFFGWTKYFPFVLRVFNLSILLCHCASEGYLFSSFGLVLFGSYLLHLVGSLISGHSVLWFDALFYFENAETIGLTWINLGVASDGILVLTLVLLLSFYLYGYYSLNCIIWYLVRHYVLLENFDPFYFSIFTHKAYFFSFYDSCFAHEKLWIRLPLVCVYQEVYCCCQNLRLQAFVTTPYKEKYLSFEAIPWLRLVYEN